MSREWTYTLSIYCHDEICREAVKSWLSVQGIDCFGEGVFEPDDAIADRPDYDVEQALAHGAWDQAISVSGYDRGELEQLATRLVASPWLDSPLRWEIEAMRSEIWQHGWKEGFAGSAIGEFWLYPPWDPPGPGQASGRHLLCVDPGMAFGTGQHATTRLCLELLPRYMVAGARGLDVGTGSGVLAMAMARLGASEVEAFDLDPDSVRAALENAQRNALVIRAFPGDLAQVSSQLRGSYQVVVANILASVLTPILPRLAELLAPGGWLILSGLLTEHVTAFVATGHSWGLHLVEQACAEDWAAVVLSRRGGAPHPGAPQSL